MRILFIHEVGYFEKPVYEMHEFPEHLSALGNSVGFVDLASKISRPKGSPLGRKHKGRVVAGSELTLFSQRLRHAGLLGRLFAVLEFPFIFRKVLSEFKPDVVVSFSVPTSGWQALLICKGKHIPYVFRALDVSHRIRRTKLAVLVKFAERFVYRNADWVSANNPALRKYCIEMGSDPDRTTVEFPPLDVPHFISARDSKAQIRKSLEIETSDFVVVYMGSFFYFSGLDSVLDTLAKSEEQVRLVLIGGGEMELDLRRKVEILNLHKKVMFLGMVDFGDLPGLLGAADVAINPMERSLVSNAALPNKVLQYMASGLPVVSTSLEGLALTFSSSPGLCLVDRPEEVLGAAARLMRADKLSELGNDNQQRILELVEQSAAVTRFRDLLWRVRQS